MRAIWSGSISFGLINVPVRLYSGTQSHDINLDMLHKKDGGKIKYSYICSIEGEPVPYKEIVKGYEYQKGEYVVLDEEDFKAARIPKSRAIEILMFTYESEIDPLYFEKPYFLEPERDAAKAYALLREALRESEKVAIAKFILRNRPHIAVIKAHDNGLVLHQLRYANEIRDWKSLNLPELKSNAKEIDMAIKLIDQLTETFKPENYKDEYEDILRGIVEDKLKGKRPKKETKEVEVSATKDLLAKLKASLDQTTGSKGRRRGLQYSRAKGRTAKK